MELTILIILYLVSGFTISCLYNAITNVPLPSDMTDEQKNMMFLIIMFWPIIFIYWLIKRLFKAIKWLFKI